MIFKISEEKKQSLLKTLQSFFDGKLEEYRGLDDAGELRDSVHHVAVSGQASVWHA